VADGGSRHPDGSFSSSVRFRAAVQFRVGCREPPSAVPARLRHSRSELAARLTASDTDQLSDPDPDSGTVPDSGTSADRGVAGHSAALHGQR